MVEVRRNGFDVFLRPRQTLVKLISSSMSSSTAFPQGEVFRFSFSANGQMVLCISSSRIVVLDVASELVVVKHELKTRRRPLGATIRDDGALLAVLSSTHRVNIYRLSKNDAKHIQALTLNDTPQDVKFSPIGSVLALAFEGSIEVYAVGEEALPTERRAVRCLRVDSLSFSSDGSMLLGSPTHGDQEGIVTITAPFYTETGTEASPEEVQMRMWTSQILFPETIDGFTHACLIAAHDEADDSWVLGYDTQLGSFRAIRTNNTGAGTVYLVSPFLDDDNQEMLPSMMPTTDSAGELVSVGFQESGLWLYGIPRRLDGGSATDPSAQNNSRRTLLCGDHHYTVEPSALRDNMAQLDKIVREPKVLIRGRQVADMHGITSARWVRPNTQPRSSRHRLVAVAPGGVTPQNFGVEDVPIDGGRVLILDFERSTTNGETAEIDIEVGETTPKTLEEPNSSLDAEVEIERRRTLMRRGDATPVLSTLAQQPRRAPTVGSRRPASQMIPNLHRFSFAVNDGANGGDAPDIPYDNTQPRSRDTLHRAATAAASTRGRYDPRYRNTPSRRYVPHESDADNWVPPPPPYKLDADWPLPEHLRRTLLPRTAEQSSNDASFSIVQRSQTTRHVRPTQQARQRPQSAILQSLGSISGPRRTARDRRISTIPSEDDPNREQPNNTNTLAVTQTPRPNAATTNVSQINPHEPTRQGPSNAAGQSLNSQPLLTLGVHTPERVPPQPSFAAPNLAAYTPDDIPYPYSRSSPNLLHIPQPQGNALDPSLNENMQLLGRQPSTGRRVSTEPASVPPPQNENWRQRIEDWNEHTIKERNRLHRRSKCIVM